MRIIARSTLRIFWDSHPAYIDAKTPLVELYRHLEQASYPSPQRSRPSSERRAFSKVAGLFSMWAATNIE
jgi:mRNA-degrading endonuclease HigB of HigAB toxin-antitoxin module